MRKLIAVVLTTLIFTVFLISCDPNTYFGEYIGVNLIENRGFDSGDWSIDYGKTVVYAYMNFVDASGDSAGPTEGTSADTNPYRLEIVNLFPNGDFNVALTGTDWIAIDGDTDFAFPTVNIVAGPIINGPGLYFDINTAPDYIDYRFDEADADDLLDGPVADATYIARFDLKVTSTGIKYYEYRDDGGFTTWSPNITDSAIVHAIPADYTESINTEFAYDTTSSYFTIGTILGGGNPQEGYIDNFRVTRSDLKHEIVIPLMYRDQSQSDGDALPLLPGTYTFSVFFRRDPTTTYGASPQNNRFDPSGVTLGIRTVESGLVTGSGSVSYPLSALDGANWTELTASFNTSATLEIPASETDVVMELFVESTNRSLGQITRDIGSILIAEPSLEFIPDGL